MNRALKLEFIMQNLKILFLTVLVVMGASWAQDEEYEYVYEEVEEPAVAAPAKSKAKASKSSKKGAISVYVIGDASLMGFTYRVNSGVLVQGGLGVQTVAADDPLTPDVETANAITLDLNFLKVIKSVGDVSFLGGAGVNYFTVSGANAINVQVLLGGDYKLNPNFSLSGAAQINYNTDSGYISSGSRFSANWFVF
jgi:hypothetical protein